MMKLYRIRECGFTLAEALLAMVILVVASAAITLPFTSGAALGRELARRTLAVGLAADMQEQILCSDYDSIADTYDGYSEPAGALKDATGAVFTDSMYQNFSRQVTCQNATVAGIELLWVCVTVYYDSMELITLGSLIGPS